MFLLWVDYGFFKKMTCEQIMKKVKRNCIALNEVKINVDKLKTYSLSKKNI
jgi:hypothetical protein